MGTSRNVEAMIRRLQRRFQTLQRCGLGLDILLGAVAAGFLVTVLMRLCGWQHLLPATYGAIGLAALSLFTVLAWRVRLSALGALIRADHTLQLREQLSTAYEYRERHPENPFVPPLTAAAERLVAQVEPRRVFPWRVPHRVWGLPVLLVALGVLLRLDVPPMRFEHGGNDAASPDVVRQGERLERWGRRMEKLAQQEQLDRSLVLARSMQDLGRRMQREGASTPQTAQRIATLSQYVQRMQQELQERALMSEPTLTSPYDTVASGKSVKQELRDMLQLLQANALPRETVALAEQGLQRLRRQVGPHGDLEQMLQNLRSGNVEAARQMLQDMLQQQQTTEEMEHIERARRALEYASRSLQRGEAGEAPHTGTPQPGDGSPHEHAMDYDADMMSEHMSGPEDFAAPGLDEGFGTARSTREGVPQALRESQQPASQVQVKSGEGNMRFHYVRHLPLQNEARVPVEQVAVTYQRAAQEVLTQERIPWDYREQIKQYFLAIGMVPEQDPESGRPSQRNR